MECGIYQCVNDDILTAGDGVRFLMLVLLFAIIAGNIYMCIAVFLTYVPLKSPKTYTYYQCAFPRIIIIVNSDLSLAE